jgi:hypothetical protein
MEEAIDNHNNINPSPKQPQQHEPLPWQISNLLEI